MGTPTADGTKAKQGMNTLFEKLFSKKSPYPDSGEFAVFAVEFYIQAILGIVAGVLIDVLVKKATVAM